MTDKMITKRKPKKIKVKIKRGYRFNEDLPTRRKGTEVTIGSNEFDFAHANGYLEGGV